MTLATPEQKFVEHNVADASCDACRRFFALYRCGIETHGECDCPKCQGYCDCATSTPQPADGAAVER